MKSGRKLIVHLISLAQHVLLSVDVVGADLLERVWREAILELLGIVLMVGVTILVDALIHAQPILLVRAVIVMVIVVVGALLPRHVCQEVHLVLLLQAHVR